MDQSEPVAIPEWLCALVGRLVIENEALRRQIQPPPPPPPPPP